MSLLLPARRPYFTATGVQRGAVRGGHDAAADGRQGQRVPGFAAGIRSGTSAAAGRRATRLVKLTLFL